MSPNILITLHYVILLIVSLYIGNTSPQVWREKGTKISFFVIVLILLHFSFREISSLYYGDTVAYNYLFSTITYEDVAEGKDMGFYLFTYLASKFMPSVSAYFFLIACAYILPVYLVFKRQYNTLAIVAFIMFLGSFSFFGYGVNGLRNGLATSFIITAIYCEKWRTRLILAVLAFFMHKSAMLPIAAYIISYKWMRPKVAAIIWMVCLLLSLFSAGTASSYIAMLDIEDQRFGSYLEGNSDYNSLFSQMGFRWDFLSYSVIPIILGYYYIVKKQYYDQKYNLMYCTYVLCNAFWLFTIYVPFNNRFAYLSWFLYPIILIHPLLNQDSLVPNQNSWIKRIVVIHYLFTFFMYLK